MITHWSYRDALVQAYTLPYVKIIRRVLAPSQKIFVVTSEQPQLALKLEELQEINEVWKYDNMSLITLIYKRMGLGKALSIVADTYKLYSLIRREKIRTIHCFGTPAGTIGYLLSITTGAKLIIDSYEPHAETMVENGTWNKNSMPFRLLFFFEKLQTLQARYLVGASSGMLNYAKEKYNFKPINFFVKPACVDLNLFSPSKRNLKLAGELGLDDKFVCVYAGKLGGIYLKDEIFDFIRECYAYWGDRFRFLMLTNATRTEVLHQMTRVGLPEYLTVQRYVEHSDIPKYLALGNFALNPVKPVPTKRYCTSIKDGEYWATGLPVVITKDISDDSFIIDSLNIGYVLKDLTVSEYHNAIRKIERLKSETRLRRKIRDTASRYRGIDIAEKIYSIIYSNP